MKSTKNFQRRMNIYRILTLACILVLFVQAVVLGLYMLDHPDSEYEYVGDMPEDLVKKIQMRNNLRIIASFSLVFFVAYVYYNWKVYPDGHFVSKILEKLKDMEVEK